MEQEALTVTNIISTKIKTWMPRCRLLELKTLHIQTGHSSTEWAFTATKETKSRKNKPCTHLVSGIALSCHQPFKRCSQKKTLNEKWYFYHFVFRLSASDESNGVILICQNAAFKWQRCYCMFDLSKLKHKTFCSEVRQSCCWWWCEGRKETKLSSFNWQCYKYLNHLPFANIRRTRSRCFKS